MPVKTEERLDANNGKRYDSSHSTEKRNVWVGSVVIKISGVNRGTH